MTNYIPTPTIGEILKEEFMEPLNLSAYKLAQSIHVPTSRIQDIMRNPYLWAFAVYGKDICMPYLI
jgi:plasmid maintenance system antidote protein VapI